MKRRDFIKTFMLAMIGIGAAPELMAGHNVFATGTLSHLLDDHLKDYLYKMKHFNEPHMGDLYVKKEYYHIFKSLVLKLRRLEETVGHGNYQILSFDEARAAGRNFSEVGDFSQDQIQFMEELFYEEAQRYGFFGQKPIKHITDIIRKKDVIKVPYTGNYLYKGRPYQIYTQIKNRIGNKVQLTSGIRGVMKQFLLFLNKAYANRGNLSLASRSLAPPGYSFHSNGDFDVGQVGFGELNFTEKFTYTPVYKKLCDLGYLKLRYPQQNLLGVRYEPWHIKIDS